MKELVEVIAKSLVDCPDEVVVTETEENDAILVELKVAPSDMGKVIGRQGRIAKAIRTVVKAASSKSEKKVVVDILQKSLVDCPDEVVVTETEENDAILVELKVAPSDMGKVIGRQGRIAKAIRTVVKAASSKSEKKVVVDILQ